MNRTKRSRARLAVGLTAVLLSALVSESPRAARAQVPGGTTTTQPTRVTTTTSTTAPPPTIPNPTTTHPPAPGATTTAPKTTTTKAGPGGLSPGPTSPDPTAPGPGGEIVNPTTTAGPKVQGTPTTPAQLHVNYLEVTQGMQNLANDMPLATGRTTIVRVYVKSESGDAANVRGQLGGWRGDKYLGTLFANNQPIVALTSGGRRVNTNDSLFFVLPPSWTAAGVTKFKAFVYQVSVSYAQDHEDNLTDNFKTEFVEFRKADPLRMVMPPLHLHNPAITGPDNTFNLLPNLGTVASVTEAAKRYFPVGEFQFFATQTPLFPPLHSGGGEWDIGEDSAGDAGNRLVPLATVLSAKQQSNQTTWQWFAMIAPNQPYTRWNVSKGTVSSVGGSSSNKVSQGKMVNAFSATTPWAHTGGGTVAHELTHNLGQSHVNCAGTESLGGGIDPNFPTPAPACSLAKVSPTGYYGFDVLYQSFPETPEPIAISNQPGVGAPNEAYPLMSYKGPGYTDPYAWCKLLVQFSVPCSAYPKAGDDGPGLKGAHGSRSLANARLAAQSTGLGVRVSGLVHRAAGNAQLLEVSVSDTVAPTEAEKSDATPVFKVEALDAAGAVLGSRVVDGSDTAAHEDDAEDDFVFSEVIAVPSAPASVRITRDGATVATRSASAAPTVRLLSPNGGETLDGPIPVRWQASDPDGGAPDAQLSYSNDAGKTWRVVTTGLGGSEFSIPAADLGGSKKAMLRVAVNDGFTTASDTSDAVFSVADQAPTVAIVSPAPARVFRLHDTVVFRGVVSDWEDLGPRKVSWSSDVDGALGSGIEVHSNELSAGRHVITMTAVDGGGASRQATVTIDVDGNNPADRPNSNEVKLATELIRDEGSSDGFPIVPVALAVVAVAVIGAGIMLARRRPRAATRD